MILSRRQRGAKRASKKHARGLGAALSRFTKRNRNAPMNTYTICAVTPACSCTLSVLGFMVGPCAPC
eukprot:946195-Prymnesium_polylepis.1